MCTLETTRSIDFEWDVVCGMLFELFYWHSTRVKREESYEFRRSLILAGTAIQFPLFR